MSYSTIGAVAGFSGQRLTEYVPRMIDVPALLCFVFGAFLVREGIIATGLWQKPIHGVSMTGCLMKPLFSSILKMPGLRNSFVAGLMTGLLPCGLVYAFVSLAASTGDMFQGLLTMMAFGAGTVPLMVIAGSGFSLLGWQTRQRIWRLAAWSVVATGLLTVGRGVSFLRASSESKPAACPFCSGGSAQTAPSPSRVPTDTL